MSLAESIYSQNSRDEKNLLRRKSLISFTLIFFILPIAAAEGTDSTLQKKHVLLANLTSPLTGFIQVGYLTNIREDLDLQISCAYDLFSSPYLDLSDRINYSYNYWPVNNGGLVVGGQLRFSFSGRRNTPESNNKSKSLDYKKYLDLNNSPGFKPFFGPYLNAGYSMYTIQPYDEPYRSNWSFLEGDLPDLTVNRISVATGLLIGTQNTFFNRLVLDFYLGLGAGLTYTEMEDPVLREAGINSRGETVWEYAGYKTNTTQQSVMPNGILGVQLGWVLN
jgi:hypothetical protein